MVILRRNFAREFTLEEIRGITKNIFRRGMFL